MRVVLLSVVCAVSMLPVPSPSIKKGDVIVMAPQDVHSFDNTGASPLELLVVAAAMEKGKLDSVNVK